MSEPVVPGRNDAPLLLLLLILRQKDLTARREGAEADP